VKRLKAPQHRRKREKTAESKKLITRGGWGGKESLPRIEEVLRLGSLPTKKKSRPPGSQIAQGDRSTRNYSPSRSSGKDAPVAVRSSKKKSKGKFGRATPIARRKTSCKKHRGEGRHIGNCRPQSETTGRRGLKARKRNGPGKGQPFAIQQKTHKGN